MKLMTKRLVYGSAVLAFCCIAVCLWALKKTPVSEVQRLFPIPNFEFVGVGSHEQKMFTRNDLLGRVWVADFIFSRCQGPCPVLSSHLSRLQEELPKSVGFLSFTVDPDWDTSKVLQKYAAHWNAQDRRWWFLTGQKEALYNLIGKGFKLAIEGLPSAQITHSTKLVLIDSEGWIRGYYDVDQVDSLSALRRDANFLSRQEE